MASWMSRNTSCMHKHAVDGRCLRQRVEILDDVRRLLLPTDLTIATVSRDVRETSNVTNRSGFSRTVLCLFWTYFCAESVLDFTFCVLSLEIAGDSFVVKLLKHIKPQDRLFRYHSEAENDYIFCCQTRISTFRTTWNLRECISDCNWRAFNFGLLCRRPVLTCKIYGHLIYAGISDDCFTEKVLKFSSVSRRNIVISRKSSVNEVVMNSFIFKRFSYTNLLRTYNEKLHEYKHTLCPQKRTPLSMSKILKISKLCVITI